MAREKNLGPFVTHGVEFAGESGDERYGTCPFCGKDQKFYVNCKTQLWNCKVCVRKGNLSQFLQQTAKAYEGQMTPQHLARLANDRRLSEEAFKGWHVGWDGRHYTIPISSYKGDVVDIRLYRRGQPIISTAGCHVGLLGAEHLAAHSSEPVYLFEGEWDTIAGNYLRQKVGADGVCVGVPGAGVLKPEWSEWFRNRVVHTHYDNDDAGAKGELLAARRLAGVAKHLTYARWPKGKPNGYDVRDFVTAPAKTGAVRLAPLLWMRLGAWAQPTPRLGGVAAPLSIPPNLSAFDQRLITVATSDAIEILNGRHFTIKTGNKYAVGDERPSKVLTLLPYEQFKNRYLWHRRGDGGDLGSIYLASPHHRHYDGQLVFKPDGSPTPAEPDDYNMWKGFALVPKPGKWNLLQAHLLENVCAGRQDWFDYFLNWIADLVQRPGRLPGVAIVLRGAEGVGKTCLFEYLAQMFPPQHTLLVSNTRGLTGNFNAHLQGKVLVLADEAFFVGQKDIIGPLQSMITSPRLSVEPKHVDIYEVENCIRLLIASNSEHVIQAAAQARRYFVLNVSDAKQKNFAYFNAITKQMQNGGTAAMPYDLQDRDLAEFNPMDFPDTAALNEQKEMSLVPHAEWLKERLMEPDTWKQEVGKDALYTDYGEWMKGRGMAGRYPLSLSAFTKYLQDSKLFGLGIHYRPHGKKRQFRFPPLAECRRAFDRRHDVQTKWEVHVLRFRRKKAL